MHNPRQHVFPSTAEYVFLDRDGVINRKLPEGRYVTCPEELELLPGAAEAIAALNRSGRKVMVVTNQRGVALGVMTAGDLAAVHASLDAQLTREGARLDAVYFCPHDRDSCSCRKPGIGMIERAFLDFPQARAENSILIGDSLSDIECGRRAGMRTIFIATSDAGDGEARRSAAGNAARIADATAGSLAEAVGLYLRDSGLTLGQELAPLSRST